MAIKRKLAAVLTAAVSVAGLTFFAPTTGWVNAGSVHLSGDEQLFTLRVDFVMTEDQLTALRCAGEYLEISAPLRGFSLPDQFDGYSVSSDLPEYLHDLANFDDSSSLSPGLTRVPTTAIEANRWYYLELKWQDDDVPGSTAEAGLLFDPSHWAGTQGNLITKAKENEACAIGLASGNDAWCIFESEFHDWGSNEVGKQWIPFYPGTLSTFSF